LPQFPVVKVPLQGIARLHILRKLARR
jgi:hypothetical protein